MMKQPNITPIEKRSIDYVPSAERHGKVWHLWPVWFSGNAQLATVATGAVGILLGACLSHDRLGEGDPQRADFGDRFPRIAGTM
jgi:purine-cytosine permease-like protein